jgi:hypothetical protein
MLLEQSEGLLLFGEMLREERERKNGLAHGPNLLGEGLLFLGATL